MSIRSKRLMLLATVFAPTFSFSVNVQPSIAETMDTPVIIAQDATEAPQEDENLQQQQAEELRQAEEEARRAAQEQQRAADEENRRQAEEQQRAAQEEADRQAEEQRKIAEQAQREAEEQQRAAEQQRANEEELKSQAEQARRQAEQEQRATEEQLRQRAEEEKKAAHEAAEKQAREQEAIAEEAKRKAVEQQATDEKAQEKTDQNTESLIEEPKTSDEPPVTLEKSAEPAPLPEEPSINPQKPQPETDVTPSPAETPETLPGDQLDKPSQSEQSQMPVAPAIVDTRTTEENQQIAKDPTKTDETVVLPVENGAAILDSDKDADNLGGNKSREDRRKLREQQRSSEENLPLPVDDASAQVTIPETIKADLPKKIEQNLKEEGKRIEAAPSFIVPETTNIVNNAVINNTTINNNVSNVKIIEQVDDRVIMDVGDRIFVRGDDRPRLRRDAERTYYDELPGQRMRETIVRPGGYEIVTIYNRYGDILQRNRIDQDGRDYLMIYAPEYDDGPRAAIVDVGYELPPMRLTVPVRDYIIDVADDPDRDFYTFLAQPPVERVERVYSIDEVRHSARLRDKVRRIDLDTIHFATGSSEVSLSQAKTLRKVADAMHKVLQRDPGETFFIEGHTDAIGSDRSNLILSDSRAESVASLLTEVYDIPAENLVTQGYGERFLKIRTQAAEQENRRVTIRRVTPLVRPVAQR